ncbi:MAG: hypothetical protein ACI4S3_03790 [Candidatus Gastranaerophilaceae bacterium]
MYKNSGKSKKQKGEKMEKTKQNKMEKFLELHVKYLYAFHKVTEEIELNSQKILNCEELKTHCPVCGHKSFVSKKLNLAEFKCINPECGFELSVEKIMNETIKTKKGIKNHV